MQVLSKQLLLDNTLRRWMLKNSQLVVMLDVESTLYIVTMSTPKGWIRESTKIGLVLDAVTNFHQGKPGIEIRIESLFDTLIG